MNIAHDGFISVKKNYILMKKRLTILFLLLPFAVQFVCAQDSTGNKKFVIVASKPMTYADSNTVKQLFFSALRDACNKWSASAAAVASSSKEALAISMPVKSITIVW